MHRVLIAVTCLICLIAPLYPAGKSKYRRMYSGPPRPRSEVALLRTGTYKYDWVRFSKVEILYFDGETRTHEHTEAPVLWEVLPGHHVLGCRYAVQLGYEIHEGDVMAVPFDAVAGHEYLLDAIENQKEHQLRIFISDVTSPPASSPTGDKEQEK